MPEPVEWRFDEPQPGWKLAEPWTPTVPTIDAASLAYTDDALRITLTEGTRDGDGDPNGGLELELPDWHREDWAYLVVRARTSDPVFQMRVGFNRREGSKMGPPFPYAFTGDRTPVITDGSVQTYLVRADFSGGIWEGPWRQLGLWFYASDLSSIDILSVALVPKEANYIEASAGARSEVRGRVYRSALYTHAPGRLTYPVLVPKAGRLDVGLGVLRDDVPVTFRVTARTDSGDTAVVFEDTYADKDQWGQRSVDLSDLAGLTITPGGCPGGGECVEWPVWASDGRTIFARPDQGVPRRIVARDLATGLEEEIYRVDPPAAVSQLAVSRDAERLAFIWADAATGTSALHVVATTAGQEPRELIARPPPEGNVPWFDPRRGAILRPAWSPDGQYVFYTTIERTNQGWGFELWRIPSAGGEPEPLGVVMDGLRPYGLSVHPDGQRIAITAGTPPRQESWMMEDLLEPLRAPIG